MRRTTVIHTRMVVILVATACILLCVDECVGTASHSHMRNTNHNNRPSQPLNTAAGQEGLKQHHRHHVPKRPGPMVQNPKMLHDNKLIHDIEHLKEELPNYIPMDKIQEMTDKELDYHYFRMHDKDENLKLDGLEILGAIMHVHTDDDDDDDESDDEEGKAGSGATGGAGEGKDDEMAGLSEEEQKVLRKYRREKFEETVNFYVEIVDDAMDENDRNNDGYLSWTEFLRGRRREI